MGLNGMSPPYYQAVAEKKEDLERCVDFLREVFLKTCRGRILMQLDGNIHRLANN